MTDDSKRGLSAGEMRRRVRRYPRDALLRAIGRMNASETRSRRARPSPDESKLAPISESYSLMLAGICVTIGKSHRRARVTDRAVGELVNELFNVRDPSLDRPDSDDALQRMLSRTTYLQMPFQNEPWPPLMRTLCLYGDDPRFDPSAIEKHQWHGIVGASVEQFLQIGFLMYVAAIQNDGAINRAVFDPARFDQIVHPLTIAEALAVADQWLTRPVEELAAAGRENAADDDDHWGYNPFFEHPIALLEDDTCVMPSPLGVLQRLSPQGVFFIIRDAIDRGLISTTIRDFSDALGKRFERYIGAQLKQLKHVTVHSEIAYDKGQKLSVDYIVETPEALVLVEAKLVVARSLSSGRQLTGCIRLQIARLPAELLIRVHASHSFFPVCVLARGPFRLAISPDQDSHWRRWLSRHRRAREHDFRPRRHSSTVSESFSWNRW